MFYKASVFVSYLVSKRMKEKLVNQLVFVFLIIVQSFSSFGCAQITDVEAADIKEESNSVDKILKDLNKAAEGLKTYSSVIEYRFSQPLFESQTIRNGRLYYKASDNESRLRINFDRLKQDEEKEQEHKEDYIFDGVWLTHIDYQLKEVRMHQLAEANEPNEAGDIFEYVSRNFPIIGFSKNENLKKEFEISLVEQKEMGEGVQLHLKVKPESIYKDNYKAVNFWIGKESNLPVRIVAVNTEDEIYEIKLLGADVNKGIDEKVFEVKVPKGFGKAEIIPLKK